MKASQVKHRILVNLSGTSSAIDWTIIGPLASATQCNQSDFNNHPSRSVVLNKPAQSTYIFYIPPQEYDSFNNHYLCVQAKIKLSQPLYLAIKVDATPPKIKSQLQKDNDSLQVYTSEPIKKIWLFKATNPGLKNDDCQTPLSEAWQVLDGIAANYQQSLRSANLSFYNTPAYNQLFCIMMMDSAHNLGYQPFFIKQP